MFETAQIYLLLLGLSIVLCSDSAEQPKTKDVCLLPQDSGDCLHKFETSWWYDHKVKICRTFLYHGCGGNGNRFKTREDCYAHCTEKLVYLHPPSNVTVAYTTHEKIFIYWYRPINYQLHDVNETATGNPVTDIISMIKPTVATVEASTNSNDVKTSVTSTLVVKSTENSVNNSTKNVTDNQSDTKNSTNDLTKDITGNGTSVSDSQNGTRVTNQNETSVNSTSSDEKMSTNIEGGVNLHLGDFVGKNPVPFHFAKLKHYILSYKIAGENFINKTVLGNETEFMIDKLEHSKQFIVILTAVYLTNTSVSSPEIKTSTIRDPSLGRECHCDAHGTKGGYKTCNLTIQQLPWCRCLHGYAGLFCEMCNRGFYRTTPSLPCHPCPCDKFSSTGSCYFVDSYLHCSQCNTGYAGQLCHRCDYGFYKDIDTSPPQCVKCKGCRHCDQYTGKCFKCLNNTTGFRCEKCVKGFIGDPANNVPCVKVTAKKTFSPPPSGIIAAIVVSVIVVLSVIIGCIVYHKMKTYPTMKPFWTVELKQDHEGVNFSSVPDQDFENYRDDEDFEEKSSKKTKSQPYLQLKEEI